MGTQLTSTTSSAPVATATDATIDRILDVTVLTRIVVGGIKAARSAHGPNADISSMAKRVVGQIRAYLVDKCADMADETAKIRISELEKEVKWKTDKVAMQSKIVRDLVAKLKAGEKL